MTDFGLKRRHPQEELQLSSNLCVSKDIVSLLTNFQIDAIRYLWSHVRKNGQCVFNDGRHMGKRITLIALILTLLKGRSDTRVLIACDSEEAIVKWIFNLRIFGQPTPKYNVGKLKRTKETTTTPPITLVNFKSYDTNLNHIIQEEDYSLIIVDVGSANTQDLQLFINLPEITTLIIVLTPDIRTQPKILSNVLKNPRKWSILRRTNEEHLREFPWLDQRTFLHKYDAWKGYRSAGEILHQCNTSSTPPVEVGAEDDTEEKSLPNLVTVEESQVMSQLMFETDDEVTPVKPQVELKRPTQSHLLSSMYLRLSQSFAGTTTPKQRIINSATVVHDSPDLFASIMDDDEEEVSLVVTPDPESQEDNTTNPFNRSTPMTPSVVDVELPSQSPIKAFNSSLPRPAFTQEQLMLDNVDELLLGNRTDVFEITSNEFFGSKIKVTTSQKHEAIEDGDEQLKFNDTDISPQRIKTPPRNKKTTPRTNPVTPSTSKWLSKRGTPKQTTPEKVLAKKRKSLMQFYAGGSSGEKGNHLDFESFNEDTQKWNAC